MPWAKSIWRKLLQILHERGYIIPAINTDTVDYETCAVKLQESILDFHPDAHVTILTQDKLPFDEQTGYANDWQVFYASPYRQTIKLEADMYCTSPIDHWWKIFELRDVVVSTGCRDFYGNVSHNRHYRKIIDENNLSDVYNAITYWRVSQTAKDFFTTVRDIFNNWDQYRTLIKFSEDVPTTDTVYAMAARLIGDEKVTLPEGMSPSIVHMKKHINPIRVNEWTNELIWELDPVRINTVAQWGMLHYHVKDWIKHV